VSKFTDEHVYICYKRVFFHISTRNKAIANNIIFRHFACINHNNLLISELLVKVHCKTLDKSTGNWTMVLEEMHSQVKQSIMGKVGPSNSKTYFPRCNNLQKICWFWKFFNFGI